jgi:membrane-bound ClpP family serine protease
MDPLLWASILLGLGLLLVGLEFFVPSGGIIAVLAGLSIIAGIAIAFIQRGPQVGLMFLVIAIISIPVILISGFKVLPHTPIGKLMIPREVDSEEVLSDIATRRHLRDMIGWIGRSTSPMLPSGSIEVEGQSFDAVSQGMSIEPNTPIKIVDVQGTRIIVRPCRAEEILTQPNLQSVRESLATTPAQTMTESTDPKRTDDLFSQSLEALGLEDWKSPDRTNDEPRSDRAT